MQSEIEQSYNSVQQLTNLDFSFSGTLQLNLRKSNLSNEDIDLIAKTISKLVNMRCLKINLQENFLLEKGTQRISDEIGKCINLQELEIILFSNSIGEKGIYSVGQALKNLQNLTSLKLDLIQNEVDNQGVIQLVNGLNYCQNLTNLDLDLYMNGVGELGLLTILNFVGYHKRIQIFSLSQQMNYGGELENYEEFIQTNGKMCSSNLKTMNLSLQSFYSQNYVLSYISSILESSSILKNLVIHLRDVNRHLYHLSILGSKLRNCQNIVYLNLMGFCNYGFGYDYKRREQIQKKFKIQIRKMKRLVQIKELI
ncbi:hypothetical protein ABPG74_019772 [Tetrahymena malaccensis]